MSEENPNLEGLERIRDLFEVPPKDSPENPFYRATSGFGAEIDYFLINLDDAEAREALATSRDNVLEKHKTLAYSVMEDSKLNDKEKARLLGGLGAWAIASANGIIGSHDTVIEHLEGPWCEGDQNSAEFQRESYLRVLGIIIDNKIDPKAKSPVDAWQAASEIHANFSRELSKIVYRLRETFKNPEETIVPIPTAASPLDVIDPSQKLEDYTRNLLGSASLDPEDEEAFLASYPDVDSEFGKID